MRRATAGTPASDSLTIHFIQWLRVLNRSQLTPTTASDNLSRKPLCSISDINPLTDDAALRPFINTRCWQHAKFLSIAAKFMLLPARPELPTRAGIINTIVFIRKTVARMCRRPDGRLRNSIFDVCVKAHQKLKLKPRSEDRSFANAPGRSRQLHNGFLHYGLLPLLHFHYRRLTPFAVYVLDPHATRLKRD
jgi:hypothetical protein